MPHRDIVVIGASAGGLRALTNIVERLPAGLRASVLVVMHTRPHGDGVLPEILERAGTLPVTFARTGERLAHGHVYVCRPDVHLLVTDGRLREVRGPRENGFRPAIDPLFRTAARQFGSRVVGVILSGALSDGAFGLTMVKQHGGVAIVQDPDEAIISSMPRNAIKAVDVDYVLPTAEIAAVIERLSRAELEGEQPMQRRRDLEPQLPAEDTRIAEMMARFDAPAPLSCPDCGGALWEVQDGRLVRYQCHVGHQFAPDTLEDRQRTVVETALWTAVRVLEEHAELKGRMARRAEETGLDHVSHGFADGARDAHTQAQHIRSLLFAADGPGARADAADRPARPRAPSAATTPKKTAARGRRKATRTRKT